MNIIRNEQLKKHTSFRIGGPADYFCLPQNLTDLLAAFDFARQKKIAVAVIGSGTNLLALDQGFRGLVIKLAGGLKQVRISGSIVRAGAGISLAQLLKAATGQSLTGLEFLAGIPGSLGGAVVMNAGAWGREIGRLVESVQALDSNGNIIFLRRQDLHFAYRSSRLQKKKIVIAEVVLKLKKAKASRIKRTIKDYLEKRKEKQPLGIPNAGSIFKNPRGKFAGQLLEAAGLKGQRIGDAQVSVKHANFIVNLGEAKASDVLRLITKMQSTVKRRFKVKLEPEIKIMVQSTP